MRNWELVVIPEDKNLQDVVSGFHAGMDRFQNQRWKTIPITRGRGKVRQHHGWAGAVEAVGNLNLPRFPKRHILLVVDFDVDPNAPQFGHEDNPAGARISQIEHKLEAMNLMPYRNRIHILGVCRQSEDLKQIGPAWGNQVPENPSSFDSIGKCLAKRCMENDFGVWDASPVLNANGTELGTLQRTVCINLTLSSSDEKRVRL